MRKFAHLFLTLSLLFQTLPATARQHTVMKAEISRFGNEAGDYKGCSLACGLPWELRSSRPLEPSRTSSYRVGNINDGNFSTCWAEGQKGDGIGSYLEFRFKGRNAGASCSFSGMTVKNGYDKSPALWEKNGRVQEFQMLINGEDMGTVRLLDTPKAQWVSVRGVQLKDGDVMRLVIKSVYPGTAYADICITEISLGGGH